MSIQRPIPIQIFHRSNQMQCPYIQEAIEQQLFTEVSGEWSQHLFHKMNQVGFRRSHNILYKPTCPNCNACKSLRIDATNFEFNKSWRRIMNKNKNLTVNVCGTHTTDEQYELFHKYVTSRHGDGEMALMSQFDFDNMVTLSPVDTFIIEFRDERNKLIAGCLTDSLPDGCSAVYSFFDPDYAQNSIGSFIILSLIKKMQQRVLPYVYLGYWVAESDKMAYKKRFKPAHIFDDSKWQILS